MNLPVDVGYEPSIFVKKPSAKFTCPLCLNVLKNPKQCSNGHCYCHGCIKIAFINRKECAVCKEILDFDKMGRNIMIKEIIDEMNTYCPTCDLIEDKTVVDRCQWIGELYSREAHLTNERGFVEICCPNKGCNFISEKRFLDTHLSVCSASSHSQTVLNTIESPLESISSVDCGLTSVLDQTPTVDTIIPETSTDANVTPLDEVLISVAHSAQPSRMDDVEPIIANGIGEESSEDEEEEESDQIDIDSSNNTSSTNKKRKKKKNKKKKKKSAAPSATLLTALSAFTQEAIIIPSIPSDISSNARQISSDTQARVSSIMLPESNTKISVESLHDVFEWTRANSYNANALTLLKMVLCWVPTDRVCIRVAHEIVWRDWLNLRRGEFITTPPTISNVWIPRVGNRRLSVSCDLLRGTGHVPSSFNVGASCEGSYDLNWHRQAFFYSPYENIPSINFSLGDARDFSEQELSRLVKDRTLKVVVSYYFQ
jgi:hypothetical protein